MGWKIKAREMGKSQEPLTLSKGQTQLQRTLNTNWHEVWTRWRQSRFRNPIKSFMWKLTNRILPPLPGTCTHCHSPWTQDHIFQECPATMGPSILRPYIKWFSPHQGNLADVVLNLWAIWSTQTSSTHNGNGVPPPITWKRLTKAKLNQERTRMSPT